MKVLSLFDGISCGQLALQRAGIKVDKYYASEIDKYAIAVTQHNFPNAVQIGDIRNVRTVDLPNIDILLAGSPCQGFSSAGGRLNFDDPRSALFFEFLRILNACKPRYFLLENVRMKREWQDIISDLVGVQPIMIDSALVSAQHRRRLYWTNIPDVKQPADKGIMLADVLEDAPMLELDRDKALAITASYANADRYEVYQRKRRKQILLYQLPHGYYKTQTTVVTKYPTLAAQRPGNKHEIVNNEMRQTRQLTVLECERLQTLPDNYTVAPGISKTQSYKAIGNGWTVDVVAHILRHIKRQKQSKHRKTQQICFFRL